MIVKKREHIYAFLDSQNLNLGTKKDIYRNKKKIYNGWHLDYKKFRVYLQDKFRVTKAFLFIGYIKENHSLYRDLERFGYILVFKPTIRDGGGNPKGNIDAELVLHSAAIEYKNYDKSVIVSGDGDFRCLHEYLVNKNKLLAIVIPNKKSESSLLKPYNNYKVFIQDDKNKLEYKKSGGVHTSSTQLEARILPDDK